MKFLVWHPSVAADIGTSNEKAFGWRAIYSSAFTKWRQKEKAQGGLHTLHGTYPCDLASSELENQISFEGLIFFAHWQLG